MPNSDHRDAEPEHREMRPVVMVKRLAPVDQVEVEHIKVGKDASEKGRSPPKLGRSMSCGLGCEYARGEVADWKVSYKHAETLHGWFAELVQSWRKLRVDLLAVQIGRDASHDWSGERYSSSFDDPR